MWILRRLKIIAHFRPLEVIANFQGDRKLSYYEIKMKKWQFSVANFWWWFEINEIEWDNCNTFEKNIRNCIFLVALVTFYNFQLTFLFADTMAPFKRYEQLQTTFYVSVTFSYPKTSFLLFIFFLMPYTST